VIHWFFNYFPALGPEQGGEKTVHAIENRNFLQNIPPDHPDPAATVSNPVLGDAVTEPGCHSRALPAIDPVPDTSN